MARIKHGAAIKGGGVYVCSISRNSLNKNVPVSRFSPVLYCDMEDVPFGNKIRARDIYDVLAPPGMSLEFLFVPGLLLTGAGVAFEYSLRMSDAASWTRGRGRTCRRKSCGPVQRPS